MLTQSLKIVASGQAKIEKDVTVVQTGQAKIEKDVTVVQTDQAKIEKDVKDVQTDQVSMQADIMLLTQGVQDIVREVEIFKKELGEQGNKIEVAQKSDVCNHRQWVKKDAFIWCHTEGDANKVLEGFQFKDVVKYCLYENGGDKRYNMHDLKEKLREKFNDIYGLSVCEQPWCFTNIGKQYIENNKLFQFCELLYQAYSGDNYTLLVLDYFLEDNFKKFNYSIDSLKETLKIDSAEERKNRVILLLSELRVVLNLRFIEGNSEITIKHGIKHSEVDCKLFTAMHYGVMVEYKIGLVSLLVLTDMSREDLKNVEICSGCLPHLVITQEDLRNEDTLTIRVKEITNEINQIRSHGDPLQVNPKELFLKLASSICDALPIKEVHLPNGLKNSLQRIYLNEDQQYFLRVNEKHIILTGSYGTGKSVMAQLKFQRLLMCGDVNRVVYFLCWTAQTAFEGMMKKYLTGEKRIDTSRKANLKVMGVNEYAAAYKLQQMPVKFSHILNDIKKRHGNSADVIVDEFDASTLSKAEGQDIKVYLKQMQESHVLLVCQAMETHRCRVVTEVRGGENLDKETKYDYYHYDDTGMYIFDLHKTMRNPNSINELSKVAVALLQEKNLVFHDPVVDEKTIRNKQDGDDEPKSEIKATLLLEKTVDREITHIAPEDGQDREKGEVIVPNIDYCAKHLANIEGTSGSRINTTIKFGGTFATGHGMEGKKPKLIYPFGELDLDFETVNHTDITKRLRYVFEHVIELNTKNGCCVVCFDTLTCCLFQKVLAWMELKVFRFTPTMKSTCNYSKLEEFFEDPDKKVLLTDYIGARGTEYNQVIVTLDPKECFLKHYVVEAMTRCTNDLSFVVIPITALSEKTEEETCKKLFKVWEEMKVVDKVVINMCGNTERKHLRKNAKYCGDVVQRNLHLEVFKCYKDPPDFRKDVTSDPIDLEVKSFYYTFTKEGHERQNERSVASPEEEIEEVADGVEGNMTAVNPVTLNEEEKYNFCRASIVVIDVFTQVLRDVLASVIHPKSQINLPSTVPVSAQRRKEMQDVCVTHDFNTCDIPLLYDLFRNICPHMVPAKGWANVVAPSDISVGAEVKRLYDLYINIENCLVGFKLDNFAYGDFMKDTQNILTRLDGRGYAGSGNYLYEVTMIQKRCINTTLSHSYIRRMFLIHERQRVEEIRLRLEEIPQTHEKVRKTDEKDA